MQIDPHRCTMEQIDQDNLSPQEVADIIFNARDERLNDFYDRDDMHRPFDGLTAQERDYCTRHEGMITQNLNTVSKQEHFKEIAADIHQLIADAQKHL